MVVLFHVSKAGQLLSAKFSVFILARHKNIGTVAVLNPSKPIGIKGNGYERTKKHIKTPDHHALYRHDGGVGARRLRR